MSKKKPRKPARAKKRAGASKSQGTNSESLNPKMYAYITPRDEREAKVVASLGYALCADDALGENCRRIPCDPSLVPMLLRDLCRVGITLPTISFDMAALTPDDLHQIDQGLLYGILDRIGGAQ
jgi:hypothetical protein